MPKRSPASRSGDDINKRFGLRLRSLREHAERSQADVGQALHVSFQQIQKYENGTTSISLDRLSELAAYFSTSVAQLVADLSGLDRGPGLTGFAEEEQAPYDSGSGVGGTGKSQAPATRMLSRETAALVDAFERIRDRKVRRSFLTLLEGYDAGGRSHDRAGDDT